MYNFLEICLIIGLAMILVCGILRDPVLVMGLACVIMTIYVALGHCKKKVRKHNFVVQQKPGLDPLTDIPQLDEFHEQNDIESTSEPLTNPENKKPTYWDDPYEPVGDTISEKNRSVLDNLTEQDINSATNRTSIQNQTRGDRERQSLIRSIRGRRAPTWEAYFREELSDHNSKRWWEPEPMLMRKATPKQKLTVDTSRFTEDYTDPASS